MCVADKVSGMILVLFSASACGKDSVSYGDPGRCSIQIEPASQKEQDALAEAFAERNGVDWVVEKVDQYALFVDRASRNFSGDESDSGVLLSETDAEDEAIQFVASNADLLGLSESEVAGLQVDVNTAMGLTVTLKGTKSVTGYEDLLPEGTRLSFVITFRDGVIDYLNNGSETLPPFDICMDPKLAADDPVVQREVVGYDLYYDSFVGAEMFAGTVEEQNITERELTVFIDRSPDEPTMTISLAYRLRVCMEWGLSWDFFVDPDTGSLIHVEQLFVT